MHYRFPAITGILFFLTLTGFSQTPVMLRVVSAEQQDTLGCNVVSEITALVYQQLLTGKAKLWDSPQKEIQITAAALVEIERSSKTSFTKQEIIYIYEYWQGSVKNLKSVTKGFSFSSKTVGGEDVSYGYVDYADVQDVVYSTAVKSNANGNFNTTLAYYLNSKNYYYHIIQYGNKVIDNITKSEETKSKITGNGVFPQGTSIQTDVPQKMVTWILDVDDKTDNIKYNNAVLLEYAIEEFLMVNQEIYFNIGGDRISTYVGDRSELKITHIEVKEVWKKQDDKIQSDLVSILIFVNDSALKEILYSDMIKMDVTIGLNSWIDFIKEKNFSFIIKKINNQEISQTQSLLYLKALQKYDWRRVTEFVKYY